MSETYYKLLERDYDGTLRSCHGGYAVWPEPKRIGFATYKPGAPVMAHATPSICNTGIHLTTDPLRWLTVMGAECYIAEPIGQVCGRKDDKVVFGGARLMEPVEIPWWWREIEAFVASISVTPWMQRVAAPRPEWKMFPRRDAASDAARGAAWDAAGATASAATRAAANDAARTVARAAASTAAWAAALASARPRSATDAARAADLFARCLVCGGLDLDPRHLAHASARWDVWQRGYGLLCDLDGVLYVYEAI